MISIYSKFRRAIAWNSLESIAYHGLYLTHHYMLFRTIDPTLYGWSSSLLGAIYFVIMIANMGLDMSMGPFFTVMSSSRLAFIRYGLSQLMIQVMILPVVALVGLKLLVQLAPQAGMGVAAWLIIIGIVVSEGLKRSVRTLLQLAFENHATTKAEIGYIGLYCMLVWSGIFIRGSCTLELLLGSLLISSLVSLIYLTWVALKWFIGLPHTESTYQTTHFWTRMMKTRLLGFVSVTSQQIFSSNFLTPALAVSSGSLAAGVFSLIATTVSSLTSLFHKVGGYTTQALLAHIKYADMRVKQETFGFITSQLFHIMITVVCFLALSYTPLLRYYCHQSTLESSMMFAYAYVGLMLCEYASIAYEKFFINEERVHYLGVYQLIMIGCSVLVLWTSSCLSTLSICLLLVRMLGVGALASAAYHIWGIYPKLAVNKIYLACVAFLCATVYMLLYYTI